MGLSPQHIPGRTLHSRKGSIANRFLYGVDYVLTEPEASEPGPWLFSRNRGNLMSLWDSDHGGPPRKGEGAPWARRVLADAGLAEATRGALLLLSQPRILGHVFNPVSFWLAQDPQGQLRAVIAEVSNTFGERHSYLCARPDKGPISAADRIVAQKIFHVSPFQPVAGRYGFRFDFRPGAISIRIEYDEGHDEDDNPITTEKGARHKGGGLLATLVGPRRPLSNAAILGACIRRPLGSRRVLTLIHWQALKLWWKGAVYRDRPHPPESEVSR